jgi:polysaccharide biosynthesis transport protein
MQMAGVEMRETSPLTEYLAVLRRRKWIVVQLTVLVPVAAFIISSLQTHVYQGDAQVLLGRQNLGAVVNGVQDTSLAEDPQRLAQTQAAIARIPAVASRAIGLAGVRGISAGDLLASSSVSPRTNADLLDFTVKNGDPKTAAKLATAYARAFTLYRRELDTATLQTARADLQRRLHELAASGLRKSAQYANLSDKLDQLNTLELLQVTNTVVREADSAAQISPRPRRNALLGLLLGAALGIGVAFLWEALDRRIKSEEDAERHLGMALLTRLPKPPSALAGANKLVMLEAPDSQGAETFRQLRTALEFASLSQRPTTIAVTSAMPQEGKSTTVANLAVALARAGQNVALVDLDLRKSMLHRFFGISRIPGVTDVALGRVKLDTALVPIQITRRPRELIWSSNGQSTAEGVLHVLPAGVPPPNPGEFMAGEALGGVLKALQEQFELLLIDTPPVLGVGDTLALSSQVDAMFVVVRLDWIRMATADDLARVLNASPVAKLGFVVTGVDPNKAYGYGPYAYGSAGPRPPRERPEAERTGEANRF